MSNITPQIALNNGYRIIASEIITVDGNGENIPAVNGTNRIIISGFTNGAGIVSVSLDGDAPGGGMPLHYEYSYYDGTSPMVQYLPFAPFVIDTKEPESIKLQTVAPNQIVNVIYLALITP